MSETSSDLVRFSRAGDVFHYRWAARRCLHMVNPNSSLKLITIEGSKERKVAGEYVIDVAEYYQRKELSEESVAYFQLKHSTKRQDTPFKLSDLKGAIEGFSKRYITISNDKQITRLLNFTIVTNRPICENFKANIKNLAEGIEADKKFTATLKKYTRLGNSELKNFCTFLVLEDGEGNYLEQRSYLQAELSELVAGVVDNAEVDTIVALVADKALPDNEGIIVREDILKRLGATSDRDLFPAPPKFESLGDAVKREQHDNLLDIIVNAKAPVIIHAEGGVGKSIVCLQLANSLPNGSKGIVYDCFGAGKYRNRSEPRHRYRDALVQISNELANLGLCKSLVPSNSAQDDVLLREFLGRLSTAISALKKQKQDAILVVFIDAADNAEMAAIEFGEPCFAHQLLREPLPDGFRLIALCRTERIAHLKPQSDVIKQELLPFSQNETQSHIERYFSTISEEDSIEFRRLTGGNPRVQANAMMMGHKTFPEVLESLGPTPTTVNDQIEAQLESAVRNLREVLPESHQEQIDSICLGLANLPPFIPIKVLAVAANVEESAIKSFVFDLGRPLWVSENSVQFRDEPTETWFREKFSATKEQVDNFIQNVKPLATTIPYVSEALPTLFLQAECYEELIKLSLSDELLPEDSPIDARNIRIYRLQFAFKAALKLKKFADASKLAMRAGEEVAGDNRQYDLLKENIDLIAPLQSIQRVQELAFRRSLCGTWEGSDNVYSAALLSSVPEFKGEARSYLRSAENWLRLYFDERDTQEAKGQEDKLKDKELVELAYSHYQLFGEKELINFVMNWRPAEVVFRVASPIIERLVDASEFDSINSIAQGLSPEDTIRYQYFCLAITKELWKVARTLPSKILRCCLDSLLQKDTNLQEQENNLGEKRGVTGIVSFAEACSANGISKRKVRRLFKLYTTRVASYRVRTEYSHQERYNYLRAVALDVVLAGNLDFDIETLLPKEWHEKEKKQYDSREIRQFNELIGGMLPWHIVRASMIVGNTCDFTESIKVADKQSSSARAKRWGEHDTLPFEISRIKFEILALHPSPPKSAIDEFLTLLSENITSYWLNDQLQALRTAYRNAHLNVIQNALEHSCYRIASESKDEAPEDRANWYIKLARAVLPVNKPDARAYFDYAIEAVSKFGDEMIERWEAVARIAKRSAATGENCPEMAYRFIRCAELIGEYVAREKYIDRDGAVEVCAMISPNMGISALSRWRDRDIGWFERQLPALIQQCAMMGAISPSVAWSFSAFSGCLGNTSLATWCLDNESDMTNKRHMFDITVRDFLILESPKKALHKLKKIADQFSLISTDLDLALAFQESLSENKKTIERSTSTSTYQEQQDLKVDCGKIFENLDVSSTDGINKAIERFDKIKGPRSSEEFWKHVYDKLNLNEAYYFLQNLIEAESADRYDVENALQYFPSEWRTKVSIEKIFPKIVKSISRRYAAQYTRYWTTKQFIDIIDDEALTANVQQGVIEGLSDLSDFLDAATFFGFAGFSTSHLTPEEAYEVLDYSLSRFEEHIDKEFGDGPWGKWLIPPENIAKATTGLIWSALASPRSSIRWEAAHCVRRLAKMDCINEIDSLVDWMKSNSVGLFGSKDYPFYVLHAKLYLLIAFARVAIDDTALLKKHHETFCQIAVNGPGHVLIQKISADIALAIEAEYSATFDEHIVTELKKVGVSQHPVKYIDRYNDKQISPWHESEDVDTSLEFFFAHDFDQYWFDPLGDVFGISSTQVQQLARHLVVNEWKIVPYDNFIDDPRENLWLARRHEREAWHSHSEYPKTDGYRFYISYHAMLSIAAKLLRAMPVVHHSEYHEDKWAEWIHMHSLSRNDGRWLSDRRDPPPLEQQNWITEESNKDWRWEVLSKDFFEGILRSKNGETWINVYGCWNECDSSRDEQYSITSALVSSSTSQSLLNALSTCSNPRDYKLPDYMEDRMEIEVFPFELKGWVYSKYPDKRLDENDTHAGDITYPPETIGKEIIEKMGIESDIENRCWYLQSSPSLTVLKCEHWGDKNQDERDGFVRRGQRLSGSLTFLTNMCKQLNKNLVIEVQITRSLSRHYNMDEDDDIKYPPPYSKVYILTKDGVFRDTTASYTLREKTG